MRKGLEGVNLTIKSSINTSIMGSHYYPTQKFSFNHLFRLKIAANKNYISLLQFYKAFFILMIEGSTQICYCIIIRLTCFTLINKILCQTQTSLFVGLV